MELGATICTPRRPRCPICPVRSFCQAFAAGLQETIPAPRKSRPTPIHARWTLCIRRHNRWLMERRPSAGRWAGLWQFLTVEAGRIPPTSAAIAAQIGIPIGPLRQPIADISSPHLSQPLYPPHDHKTENGSALKIWMIFRYRVRN
jgi:A/G-specific adenine glycosylase